MFRELDRWICIGIIFGGNAVIGAALGAVAFAAAAAVTAFLALLTAATLGRNALR